MNIRLLYWNFERRSSVSSRWTKRAIISARVGSLLLYQSKSWRGMPERWVTRSRGVIRAVVIGSERRKLGR